VVRFLSVEPLLEDLGVLDLRGIHWVIVGGESGPHFRPMDHAWARAIRDQCVAAGVAFFLKQSAAFRTEVGTALVEADGSAWEWRQYPGALTPPQRRGAAALLPRQLPLGLGRKT
jgi:protein gp37